LGGENSKEKGPSKKRVASLPKKSFAFYKNAENERIIIVLYGGQEC